MSTVADAVLAGLAAADVDTVFGFPGETSLPLYIAAQRQSSIRHVLARCPRCAGYMADAFAQVSGTVGICDAPGGIGSPFTTPALLEAFNSSTPLVFLASGMSRVHKGRWTTGECAQQDLFSPVCKATVRLETADDAGSRAANAVRLAEAPRSGPVFLEVPSDVLVLPCDQDTPPPQRAPPSAPNAGPVGRQELPSLGEVHRPARTGCPLRTRSAGLAVGTEVVHDELLRPRVVGIHVAGPPRVLVDAQQKA